MSRPAGTSGFERVLTVVVPLGWFSLAFTTGGVIAAVLCVIFLPRVGQYQQMLVLPLIIAGVIGGFAVVYGVWHRTRSELLSIVSEGVIPYLLGTAGVFALIGLAATPLIEEPKEIIGSIWQVNLLSDGSQEVVRQLEPAPLELDNPDEAPFQKVPMDYVMFNVSELTVVSDKTIIIADAASPAQFRMPPVRIDAAVLADVMAAALAAGAAIPAALLAMGRARPALELNLMSTVAMCHAAVPEMRERLVREGVADPAPPGTPFDDALTHSVRRFQRARGLAVDGVVGPETLFALAAGDPGPRLARTLD